MQATYVFNGIEDFIKELKLPLQLTGLWIPHPAAPQWPCTRQSHPSVGMARLELAGPKIDIMAPSRLLDGIRGLAS